MTNSPLNGRRRLLPHAKVFDNHLLIDPVAALYEREDAAYQPLRKRLVIIRPIYLSLDHA